jgi:hypothetical protein
VLLWAAFALVVVVVAGVATIIGLDLSGRPPGQRLGGVKEWQPLLGAVLGFLGAAGVLVASNVIQAEAARGRALQANHAIGMALALEAERLFVGVRGGLSIGGQIDAMADPQAGAVCRSYAATLRRILSPNTPIYSAALGSVGDFGDYNLAVFVRFYAAYQDFLRDLDDPGLPTYCDAEGADEIGYMVHQLQGTADLYGIIANAYGTVPPEATAGVGVPTAAKP